jgi:NADPH-dependent curcumin reductase CurA
MPLMLQVGDRVLCYQYTGDLYREHVVVPASNCFVLPSCMSYEDGAALAANYLTAYFCVLDIGHMRAGQSILISSCAGISIHPTATQISVICSKLCNFMPTSLEVKVFFLIYLSFI